MPGNETCPTKMCEEGGEDALIFLKTLGFPMYSLPNAFRAVLYMILLGWTFMGVAIVSDVFMGAIERITSRRKRIVDTKSGHNITVKVWNDTVANLTLMALGSSAPEILLSVIELVNGKMHSGDLGPATIVGSAAFNLFCISAVCVMAIPAGEIRKIKDTHVFFVTAAFSIFAYLWLYFIVAVSSENVILLWEALLTFLMFPALVALAYFADTGGFSSKATRDKTQHPKVSLSEVSKEELAAIEMKILQKHGPDHMDLSDNQVAKMIQKEHAGPKTRAQYRVQATRNLVGGKRVDSVGDGGTHAVSNSSVVPFDSAAMMKGEDVTIEFASPSYAVIESVGTLTLAVHRSGDMEIKCCVDFQSRDGTAKAFSDYTPVEGTLEFLPGVEVQNICVTIIDDTAYEDDEEFYVHLTNARCPDCNYSACLGRNDIAKIAIVDDDEPGILLFQQETQTVQEGLENKIVPVLVRRMNGSTGRITCKYHTEDASATAGRDYEPISGMLTFENGETSAQVDLTILPRGRYDLKEEFRLILTEPTDGARFDDRTDGGSECCILSIVIEPDETQTGRIDRVMQVLQMDWDKAQIGHSNWRDQFRAALFANGGDEEQEVTPLNLALHIVTVFWKVLFAFIPPADFCHGWACFFSALFMIGVVTAVIGDLAGLLGCVMGMPGSITAITFVALGTSLPDTFASKTAAEQDPYADASIGNVTGSNSVNVFLGLGMPWTLGAIYWMMQDKDFTQDPVKDWAERYPTVAADYKGEVHFVVMGGSLGFSVGVFSSFALLTIGILMLRRRAFGGELGGPRLPQIATAMFFIGLWFLYVTLSSIKALSEDDCL